MANESGIIKVEDSPRIEKIARKEFSRQFWLTQNIEWLRAQERRQARRAQTQRYLLLLAVAVAAVSLWALFRVVDWRPFISGEVLPRLLNFLPG